MQNQPFAPMPGATIAITNAITASADQVLPPQCNQVMLYNSSATAIAFVRITTFPTNALGAAVAPSVTADMPVPPNAFFTITVGPGEKEIRSIASAANGTLYVTPGMGRI